MAEPVARRQPLLVTTDGPTYWLRLLPPTLRLVLHGDFSVRAAAAPVWGVQFSEEACRALTGGSRATLWLGPDEYLLIDFAQSPDATTAQALDSAIGALPHALVDVSHRQFALEISGSNAAGILNGGCPLDLDIASFPIGMCTRTVFAKADITLWRTHADVFHVEVWRSFSGYVSGLLQEIAKDYHTGT